MAMVDRELGTEVRCACGGALETAVVGNYRFEDEFGHQMLVHHVPAAVCTRCGDVQLAPNIVAAIDKVLRRAEHLPRHLDYAAD